MYFFLVNGVFIPKGTRIQMPTWASHYYEEFFPEPEKFLPGTQIKKKLLKLQILTIMNSFKDRFLKENSDNVIPFTWRPFGGGHRVRMKNYCFNFYFLN